MNDQFEHLEEDRAMAKEIISEFGEGWLPPRPEITIPAPLAKHGDKVVVENYRLKVLPTTDEGTVREVSYRNSFGAGFEWQYEVWIDRAGYGIHVRDKAIVENLSK